MQQRTHMKKHLFVLALAVGLVGCVSESRTVEREVSEPAGSTTIIDTDNDRDDTDVKIEAETDDNDLKVETEVDK
jgi:PBP1b-binding outer membrane lipoprotein LpoB